MSNMSNAVQKHGIFWEKELLINVYGATEEEFESINHTSRHDLPSEFNRVGDFNLSVKVHKNKNKIDMADCRRLYEEVSSGRPIHMTAIHYCQDGNIKRIVSIIEIDLTNTGGILFGTLALGQIEDLVKEVKKIPNKRRPTPEEHKSMYELQEHLQSLSGAIYLNIKCDSKSQRRLQCSFNDFQSFIENHPKLIVSKSVTNEFRGGSITREIQSENRKFTKKIKINPINENPVNENPVNDSETESESIPL